MRNFLFFTLVIVSLQSVKAQLPCGTSNFTLNNSNLGTVGSNVSSYTYSSATFNMAFNVFVQKTAGNGPNFYPYGTNSLWVGKDNNVNLDSVVVEITFTGLVYGVMLDFGAINNNTDGEEQIQRIYPKLSNGQLLTNGVTYTYQPGVPTGTAGGTYFVNSTKTIKAYSGNADDGRLIISATTPFKKIRFTQREITALSASGPNGILVKRISYCPEIPDIKVTQQNVNQAINSNSNYGTVGIGNTVTKTFEISNQGTGNLSISSIALTQGTQWHITNNPPSTVAPLDTVFVNVSLTPQVSGNLSDQITITSNDWDEASYGFNLSGIGVASQLQLQHHAQIIPVLDTVTVDSTLLGSFLVDSVYIVNNGQAPLSISNVVVTGSTFSWIPAALPLNLAPGTGQYLHFSFTPVVGGFSNGNLQVQSNDPNSPQNWVLNGYGINPFAATPEIQVIYNSSNFATGSVINLGACTMGSSLTVPVIIKNIGAANLNLSNLQSTNPQFSLTPALSGTLAPGASIPRTITLTPSVLGITNGTIFFSTNDLDENPFIFHLVGTGMAPLLTNCTGCNRLGVNSNPMHKAEWVDNLPVFEWQHEEGIAAAYYKVELFKVSNANNTEVAIAINGNLVNTVTAPGSASYAKLVCSTALLYKTLYSWKVTAFDANNLPIACFKRQFTTIPKPSMLPLNCLYVPGGVDPFGTRLGAVNNVPIYKNGGCENGIYNKASTTIQSQSGWSYGWQCVELPARFYFTRYRINIQGGNGKDYFDVTGNRKGLRQMTNGLSTSAPKMNDMITFMRADPNAAGHVAMIRNFTPGYSQNVSNYTLNMFQQNWGSNVSQHLNYPISLKLTAGKWKATSAYPTTRGWVRAIPEIVSPGITNGIPTISTTTPTFTWIKHNNIKGYRVRLYKLNGNCYQQVGNTIEITGNQINGQGFPALTPGATYKWTVENRYFNIASISFQQSTTISSNAEKSVISDNYYFKVSASATGGILGPVVANGGNQAALFLQAVASPVNGASIFIKNTEDWIYLDQTHGNGAVDILQEFTPCASDSMLIIRSGYFPTKFSLNQVSFSDKMGIPMIDQRPPIVFRVSHGSDNMSPYLNVEAENAQGFWLSTDGGTNFKNYPATTQKIPVNLSHGMNYFEFMVFNGNDTVFVTDKWLYTDYSQSLRKIQIINRESINASLYLDGDLYSEVHSHQHLALPEGSYTLTLIAPGYVLERYLIEKDTIIIYDPRVRAEELRDTSIVTHPDHAHFLWNGLSIHGLTVGNIEIGQHQPNTKIPVNPWSQTLYFNTHEGSLDVSWIVDRIKPIADPSLLIEQAGTWRLLPSTLWGDSVRYEADFQILKLKGWNFNGAITLVESMASSRWLGHEIRLIPNPNSGATVEVLFSFAEHAPCSYRVIDLQGRCKMDGQMLLDENQRASIAIESLAPGLYNFEFQTSEGLQRVPFVRQ